MCIYFAKKKKKKKKSTKVRIFSFIFWVSVGKPFFCRGDRSLGFVHVHFWCFFNIALFPEILIVNSLRNSWDKSHRNFVILDIKFCFVFGKYNLYKNFQKFQNIINRLPENFPCVPYNFETKCSSVLTQFKKIESFSPAKFQSFLKSISDQTMLTRYY